MQAATLLSKETINHLDHLAVIAYILKVPLLTDDLQIVEMTKRYYPQIEPIFVDHQVNILEQIATHCDTLFVSSANFREDLAPLLNLFFGAHIDFWYCPHGHSDKPLDHFNKQTHSLIYGNLMKDRLNQSGLLSPLTYAQTGDYRLVFYKRYKPFYDRLVEQEIFSRFQCQQPTFLYAPTWQDLTHASSLFELAEPLIEQLPPHYNLIVKLHPWLDFYQPAHVQTLKERHHHRPNLLFLSHYPLILPLLERVDCYVGDFSSIGYDFLRLKRPMFFCDPSTRSDQQRPDSTLIHSCGRVIPPSAYDDPYRWLAPFLTPDPTMSRRQQALYTYAFGEPPCFTTLNKRIAMQAHHDKTRGQRSSDSS